MFPGGILPLIKKFSPSLFAIVLAAGWLLLSGPPARGVDRLNWDKKNDRVDAEIQTWPVPKVLQQITAATGWKVLVDPGIKEVVSTKFKNKPAGDALERLLGDLNYALIPQTNGPSKLLVFRSAPGDATLPVAPPKKPANLIDNELIVTLKPGQKIDGLARRNRAKVIGRAAALNAYRLKFGDADAADSASAALANESGVEAVDANYSISIPETPRLATGGGTPFTLSPTVAPDGKYTTVGLVDTAVQGRQGGIADFISSAFSVAASEPAANSSSPWHGTSMAEGILKSANDGTVRIASVDVYGGNATTSMFDVGYGIYKVINDGHATIVNLSLAGEGQSAFVDKIINEAHARGVIFVAAAGNEHIATPMEPAANANVISVTSSDGKGGIASYANISPTVDVAAPGTIVVQFDGRYYSVTGTSTSTALVSGLAAGIAASTHKPVAEVEAAIRKTLAIKAP